MFERLISCGGMPQKTSPGSMNAQPVGLQKSLLGVGSPALCSESLSKLTGFRALQRERIGRVSA
jgi:hypothetical protein